MNLDISRLNLKSIQGFTLNNLKESTGFFLREFYRKYRSAVVGDLLLMTSDLRSPNLTLPLNL
jgi:hypothetical protein